VSADVRVVKTAVATAAFIVVVVLVVAVVEAVEEGDHAGSVDAAVGPAAPVDDDDPTERVVPVQLGRALPDHPLH
jgi:hypothetical protein